MIYKVNPVVWFKGTEDLLWRQVTKERNVELLDLAANWKHVKHCKVRVNNQIVKPLQK